MKSLIFSHLVKGAARLIKRAALKPFNYFKAETHHLVFVFGARTRYWPQMGKDLYVNNALFKKTIHQCDEIIQRVAGKSILPNFEGPLNDRFFEDQEHIGFTVMAIQVGILEILKAKGINPDEIMGISVGELTAIYAAGGLTLEETFKLCKSGYAISAGTPKEYITMFLFADMETATRLCKESKLSIMPVYHIGERNVLAYCHQDEIQQAIDFFDTHNIKCKKAFNEPYWPVHTPIINPPRALLDEYTNGITAQPIQFNHYSPTYGKVIPKHSVISNDYWCDSMRKPVLLYPIINLLKPIKNVVLLHIGPQFFLKSQFQSVMNHDAVFLDSMPGDANEAENLEKVIDKFKKLKLTGRKIKHLTREAQLNDFIHHLNLSSPEFLADPYPAFDYLRSNGPVHFLPHDNAWLVLDHETINYVLQQPQLFSSSVHQDLDSVLLGADPPSHTAVRSMMQPLFSPQSFTELGNYTYYEAHKLLDAVTTPEFDAVNAFSLPLAQKVIAHFLGLNDNEAQALQQCVNGRDHVYAMAYLEDLKDFFREHLTKKMQSPGTDIGSTLLAEVAAYTLTFEEAVSLMRMLWAAGMTTTSMLLTHTINFLIRNPDIALQLRADESLINKYIEECLRLEAPGSDLRRLVTQDVEIGGKKIPAGSMLMLSIRAANRQPEVYPNPHQLLLTRTGKRHLSFGGGYHYCLGIGMARIEVKNAIKVFLERFPVIEHAVPGQMDQYFSSVDFRAITSLTIRNNMYNKVEL